MNEASAFKMTPYQCVLMFNRPKYVDYLENLSQQSAKTCQMAGFGGRSFRFGALKGAKSEISERGADRTLNQWLKRPLLYL